MTYPKLISAITENLHFCATALSKWLEKRLPSILGDNWWSLGVLDNLSYNQREIVTNNGVVSLAGLDLSALLRVADKNWYAVQNRYFLKSSERETLRGMFSVRNNWKHDSVNPPTVSSIIADMNVMLSMLYFVEADSQSLNDFTRLIDDIQSNGLSEIPDKLQTEKAPLTIHIATPITGIILNSVVHLVSDRRAVGIVTEIGKIGGTSQYSVFIDGKIKKFFEGQIEIEQDENPKDLCDINDIRCILTAYQIKKPSSDSLYSLNSARIDFVPYQFRPALKLIKSDTPRLLIADSVGVGKTIEAGLIIKEMQARTSLDTIVIICPKPLVAERKWEVEMKRFDEDFVAVDGDTLRYIITEAERDGEWPDRYKRLIIPYSLLTEDLLEGKTGKRCRKQPGLNDIDPTPFFDMVIVDEAHHVRNRETQAYRAVKYFCDNANAAVFLTATPLQLGNEDLFTLLNLLYPDTVIDKASFNAMVEPNSFINEAVHNLRIQNGESAALQALEQATTTDWGRNVIALNPIYRQAVETITNGEFNRSERVKLISDIESLHSFAGMINRTRRQDIEDFCIRRAYTLTSDFTDRQRELHDDLLEFIATILSQLHPTISLKFLMCTIRRQAASCIFGLAPAISDIIERGFNSITDDYDVPDELDKVDIDIAELRVMATRITALAENLPAEDNKFDGLGEIISKHQNLGNNKMIVFSTFRHTLRYLFDKIKAMNGIRVAYVDGSVKDDERYAFRERFALPKVDPRALDILLFTEVGSEGLDYQFCDTIVNYDLPWNPMRVEQRIGRIDRRGQQSDVAHIYNCITHGTIDEEIYERCLLRIGVFEQSIGDCSDILGTLAKGINDLILDSKLTETERSVKLEQLADNEVRKVQEMRKLEDDEKQMFGLDISTFTEDINKADNPWLAPDSLRRLVIGYFDKRLSGDTIRLSGDKIKLSSSEKLVLAEDYKSLGGTYKDVSWERYLRSGNKVCNVVFDQDAAKDPKTLFINSLHPLVRQAAEAYFADGDNIVIAEISSSDIVCGEYPFQFYVWEFTGGKPRMELVAICADNSVQAELPLVIQYAVSQMDNAIPKQDWSGLSERHLSRWQTAREKYKADADALCRYKVESLLKSTMARKNVAIRQMSETSNERIIQMRTSEISRLDSEFEGKKTRLEESARLADIHTTLVVNGILVVKGE
jgi:ERCC4-related helicase